MRVSFILFLLLLFSSNNPCISQANGAAILDPTILHEVRIEFSEPNYWQILNDNFAGSWGGQEVDYLMAKVYMDGELVDSTGVRFKGFTSFPFESDKKPIKLDFNEFVPGQRYNGLRKINLNNATGDPAMQRDILAYKMLRQMGVAAPRTAFSRLYINDEYWGIYQLIEQVDKEFLEENFASSKGNLFKNKGWSHLEWLGTNDQNYHPPFQLKTNEEEADWSGFVDFVKLLNVSSDADFTSGIEDVFDVDLYLKVLAIDVATNNWDSYLQHGRNWYMYQDLVHNRFHWIPWDYNFSMDGGYVGISNDGNCDFFPEMLYLTDGTTQVSFFDESKVNGAMSYEWDFGDGLFSNEKNPIHNYEIHGNYKVCLTITLNEDCENTNCLNVNTSFNPAECNSILSGSCPYPADVFYIKTINQNSSCCTNWTTNCDEYYNFFAFGASGSENFSIDQKFNIHILIKRLLSVDTFYERYLNYVCKLMDEVMIEASLFSTIDANYELIDTSVQQDPHHMFNYYSYLYDIGSDSDDIGLKRILTNRIDRLKEELNSMYDCSNSDLQILPKELVINEFMAKNEFDSGIQDEEGKFEDWIEIYNPSKRTIELSNLYMSDDPSKPFKWKFPVGVRLKADDYLTLWADDDIRDEGIHSAFKLAKDGGYIGLFNEDGSEIDEVIYGAQETSIAAARIPNGAGDFVLQKATFGYNNEQTTGIQVQEIASSFTIAPNPANNYVRITCANDSDCRFSYRLFGSRGENIAEGKDIQGVFEIDTRALTSGLYICQIMDEDGFGYSQKIIVQHE